MPPELTWLDYSDYERCMIRDVIELFGERTTRTELGLGGVRFDSAHEAAGMQGIE